MRTGITESAVSINEPAVAEKESAKRTAAHSDPHRFLHGMKKSLAMCSSLLIALQSQRAVAEPVWAVGVNPSQGGVDSLVQPGMAGWTFSLTTSVKVMGLGWYDQNLDGLSEAHQLGVWQYASATNLEYNSTNGLLLFSLVIPAGTNAMLNGSYREVDLTKPIVLPVGYYVIAGSLDSTNADSVNYISGSLAPDPRMFIGGPAYAYTWENPNAPLFRIPDAFTADPIGWGLDLGPNLLVVRLPSLQATKSGNQILLSWPQWATNYVLETIGGLGAGASWTTATNVVAASGSAFWTTNSISSASSLYRLRGR